MRDFENLILQIRLSLENKKDTVNSILISGKNINGVLGLGKKDIEYKKVRLLFNKLTYM